MPKLSKFISNFNQSSKRSFGSKDCILAEQHRKFHGTLKSFLLGVQKNQLLAFLLKRFFLRKILWTREMQILKPCKYFCQKSENPTIKLRNRKHLFFSKNYHLLKKHFWRHKLHFWQPSSKIVCQNPKNFTHKVRKHIKSKYLLIQFLSGQKNALLKILSKIGTKSFPFFRSIPEIIKQKWFFQVKTERSYEGPLVT